MSIEIGFRDLYIPLSGTAEGEPDRAPLDTLNEDERSHVHGTLWIRVNGCDVPALGYFGTDDACMGTWAHELATAVDRLGAAESASYVFDEGEQGQPAFVFERQGDVVYIRVEASRYSEDAEPPSWVPEACRFREFKQQVAEFLDALDAAISSCTSAGIGWVDARVRDAG